MHSVLLSSFSALSVRVNATAAWRDLTSTTFISNPQSLSSCLCECVGALIQIKVNPNIRYEEVLERGSGHCVGRVLISLPVNDDRVRGRLVSVAATFLLTTAAEWAVKKRQKRGKSQRRRRKNKLNRRSHCLSGPSTSTGPDSADAVGAEIQEHTKEASEGRGGADKRIKEEEKVQQHTLQTVRDHSKVKSQPGNLSH